MVLAWILGGIQGVLLRELLGAIGGYLSLRDRLHRGPSVDIISDGPRAPLV